MSSIETLVKRFAEGVAGQTDAIEVGDSKEGNRCAKRYISAFRDLISKGDEGREALWSLVHHERQDVRVMMASFLLRYRHDAAYLMLEEAARGTGLVALGAAQTLKRWKEGTWNLDPT